MSMDFTGLCREHSFESAVALCRRCGHEYCDNCVVYPFGAKKPVCKACAISMGGVRSAAGLPAMPPRLVKKRAKAFAKYIGAAGEARATSAGGGEAPDDGPLSHDTSDTDAAPTTDWSQPFD